jgi:cytochrome c biogenesis protein ResB
MPPQEVKKYSSYVTIYTEEGLIKNAVIEVNKPLSVDNWTIYQYSYDDSMGKYSDTSIFELVRDPWLKMVYTGIIMLMAGALFIFIAGPKQNKV